MSTTTGSAPTGARPAALPRLHVITDTRGGRDPLPVVRAALAAASARGVGIAVQVRAKEATDRALLDLARQVVALADPAGALVLVDDRLDIALAAGAAGVHLGAHDLPIEDAARWAGPGAVLGGTAREPVGAAAAARAGASYLGVGPVFATRTKVGLPDPLGTHGVHAVASTSALPVIAIGGITAGAVPALRAAGAHGVAVVTAVSEAADPQAATAALLDALGAAA